MRSLIIFLIFISIAFPCSAERMYVLIDNIGIQTGGEKGQTNRGEVIETRPLTNPPTRAELSRCKIWIVDLTQTEADELVEDDSELKMVDGLMDNVKRRERKVRIDIDNVKLSSKKQKEEISVKKDFTDNIIVKPSIP